MPVDTSAMTASDVLTIPAVMIFHTDRGVFSECLSKLSWVRRMEAKNEC